MGSLSSKKIFFGIHRPWIWEPAKALISGNAWLSANRSGQNILAQLSKEKQWVGGKGGVYYTRPSLPIVIKYKLEFGLNTCGGGGGKKGY